MKTTIRINSTIKNGIGGMEAGFLELIYMHLFNEYSQDFYSHIGINQIDEELDEIILQEGKKIYINIRYPLPENYLETNDEEKNKFSLLVVHEALKRICEYENKLNIRAIEDIYECILNVKFSFEFLCKQFIEKDSGLKVLLVVHPYRTEFKYYLVFQPNSESQHKMYLYSGLPTPFLEQDFFYKPKWKSQNELVIKDRDNEMQFIIDVKSKTYKVENLTRYSNPPSFTKLRTDVSEEQKKQAQLDWQHSLPPAIASIIRQADN